MIGTVDNVTSLNPADDVAKLIWGGNWRIPTKFESKSFSQIAPQERFSSTPDLFFVDQAQILNYRY